MSDANQSTSTFVDPLQGTSSLPVFLIEIPFRHSQLVISGINAV